MASDDVVCCTKVRTLTTHRSGAQTEMVELRFDMLDPREPFPADVWTVKRTEAALATAREMGAGDDAEVLIVNRTHALPMLMVTWSASAMRAAAAFVERGPI